ncbi:MAG TPA: isochorismatase family protein [Acidimicrobiales bacterium]|nr:isochorismatase family protein [Acidimicrobiales bacterium]
MPVDLGELLAPATTAVVTMEAQRNVVGDLSPLPALREAVVAEGILPRIGALHAAAREVGATVVQCLAVDEAWSPRNYAGAVALARRRTAEAPPPDANDPVAEIGPAPGDLRAVRHHGVSPFTGTDLDVMLRTRGTRTVVACGVSLNIGIPGMVIEAVGLGYRAVVATDAVVGVPPEFGRAVLAHSLPFVATLLTVEQIAEVWGS